MKHRAQRRVEPEELALDLTTPAPSSATPAPSRAPTLPTKKTKKKTEPFLYGPRSFKPTKPGGKRTKTDPVYDPWTRTMRPWGDFGKDPSLLRRPDTEHPGEWSDPTYEADMAELEASAPPLAYERTNELPLQPLNIKSAPAGSSKGLKNILAVIAQATPEELEYWQHWYGYAHLEAVKMARRHNRPIDVAAGVIAVLSPKERWDVNLYLADRALAQDWEHVKAMDENRGKAFALVVEGDFSVVGGGKVFDFFLSILDPAAFQARVVVDTHAINIWQGVRAGSAPSISKNERKRIAADYAQAGALTGLSPQAIQAITWVLWRQYPTTEGETEEDEERDEEDVPEGAWGKGRLLEPPTPSSDEEARMDLSEEEFEIPIEPIDVRHGGADAFMLPPAASPKYGQQRSPWEPGPREHAIVKKVVEGPSRSYTREPELGGELARSLFDPSFDVSDQPISEIEFATNYERDPEVAALFEGASWPERPTYDSDFALAPQDPRRPDSAVGRANIEAVLAQATPDEVEVYKDWYLVAHNQAKMIAAESGHSLEVIAAVIAALSPGSKWEANLRAARRLALGQSVAGTGGFYPVNVYKAIRALRTKDPQEALTGDLRKVMPFYQTLVSPKESAKRAVVDRHMFAIWYGDTAMATASPPDAVYRQIQADVLAVGEAHDLSTQAVQAITWVLWRNRSGKERPPSDVQPARWKGPEEERYAPPSEEQWEAWEPPRMGVEEFASIDVEAQQVTVGPATQPVPTGNLDQEERTDQQPPSEEPLKSAPTDPRAWREWVEQRLTAAYALQVVQPGPDGNMRPIYTNGEADLADVAGAARAYGVSTPDADATAGLRVRGPRGVELHVTDMHGGPLAQNDLDAALAVLHRSALRSRAMKRVAAARDDVMVPGRIWVAAQPIRSSFTGQVIPAGTQLAFEGFHMPGDDPYYHFPDLGMPAGEGAADNLRLRFVPLQGGVWVALAPRDVAALELVSASPADSPGEFDVEPEEESRGRTMHQQWIDDYMSRPPSTTAPVVPRELEAPADEKPFATTFQRQNPIGPKTRPDRPSPLRTAVQRYEASLVFDAGGAVHVEWAGAATPAELHEWARTFGIVARNVEEPAPGWIAFHARPVVGPNGSGRHVLHIHAGEDAHRIGALLRST